MSDVPLGDTFSPLTPQNPGPQGGARGGGPLTPQQAIQILSFRSPRNVGASSPIPQGLLNAPGGAGFGPAGGNLDQLLALLFGTRRPGQGMDGGVSGLPEPPQMMQPLPWMPTGPGGGSFPQPPPEQALQGGGGRAPAPGFTPGDKGETGIGQIAPTAQPSQDLPWNTPQRDRRV